MVLPVMLAMGAASLAGGVISAFGGRSQAHATREVTEANVEALEDDIANLGVSSQMQRDYQAQEFMRASKRITAAAGASGVRTTSASVVNALRRQMQEQARQDSILVLQQEQQERALRQRIKITKAEGRAAEKQARSSGVGGILGGVGQIIGGLF